MTDSGIAYQQIDIFGSSPFWKKNESLLKELEESKMPSRSRLIFKDVSNRKDNDNTRANYDLVNIYDNRKNFFSISAEFAPDNSSIIREEIIAGNKLSDAKKTVVEGNRITNKSHIQWLREMGRNDVCRLFHV